MAVGVTEGGLAVGTSADARKRCANHQSGCVEAKYKLWPTYRLASSPEVGPRATVGTQKLGYPLLLYEDTVPTRLSLSRVIRCSVWDQAMTRPSLGRLLWVHNSALSHHMGGSGATMWPEKVIYSKASTVSPDPHGKVPDPWIYSPDLQVGPGPPRVRTGPLEWDPDPPPMGSGLPTVGSQDLT
jgi:hypothetical protein